MCGLYIIISNIHSGLALPLLCAHKHTHTLALFCRKFDIGVYTVITSADPLRAYAYQEEILLRYIHVHVGG